MWNGVISISELMKRKRWKVEQYAASSLYERPLSQFDWVRIGQLVDERRESLDPQEYPNKRFHYLSLENVESHTGDLVRFVLKTGKEVLSRSKVFKPDDVLFGRLRPNLNKVFLASSEMTDGICSGEFYVLVPKSNRIRPRFLREVLASRLVFDRVSQIQTGSALPRLPLNDLLEIDVPLPPLEVQDQIDVAVEKQVARRLWLRSELVKLGQSRDQSFLRYMVLLEEAQPSTTNQEAEPVHRLEVAS